MYMYVYMIQHFALAIVYSTSLIYYADGKPQHSKIREGKWVYLARLGYSLTHTDSFQTAHSQTLLFRYYNCNRYPSYPDIHLSI